MSFTISSGAARQRIQWLAVLSTAVAASAALAPMTAGAASTAESAHSAQVATAPPCDTAWDSAKVYLAGDRASKGGKNYKSNWWNQGEDPTTHSGAGQSWTVIEDCAGGGTPPPPPPQKCDPWRNDFEYAKKSFVTGSNSQGYKALKPSVGKDPVTNNGPKGSGQPWTKTGKCVAPPVDKLMFSSYKDITINLNWNTNVLSTKVTGTLSPVLSVMPGSQTTATWAFASGECGSENWAGVTPSALVAANVANWVAAGKKYIISTGGAAGSFTCGSDAGFDKFISTYNSASMLGVDFDIEGGQSQAVIDALVARVKWAQTKYPNMRFSFTLATFGGNLPQSLGAAGEKVMNSIRAQGLTKYIINLMTMDYGSPTPGNCTLGSDGQCDMGKSAINAGINLHNHWAVPYNQIEITPMIGGNDTPNETFTLEDTDELSAWVKSNGVSGVHIWSLDRDTDCAPGWASPICNSYGQAGNWGFTNRFISKLFP